MYRNPQCDSDTGILRNQDTDPGEGMPPCVQGPGPQDRYCLKCQGGGESHCFLPCCQSLSVLWKVVCFEFKVLELPQMQLQVSGRKIS